MGCLLGSIVSARRMTWSRSSASARPHGGGPGRIDHEASQFALDRGATSRSLLVVNDLETLVAKPSPPGRPTLSVGEEHGWRLGQIVDPFGLGWEIGVPLGNCPPSSMRCDLVIDRANAVRFLTAQPGRTYVRITIGAADLLRGPASTGEPLGRRRSSSASHRDPVAACVDDAALGGGRSRRDDHLPVHL